MNTVGAIVSDIQIHIPADQIRQFCRKWNVQELSLFGSALRDDFRGESDIDLLITFNPGGGISFENRADLLEELSAIFGRKVDLVEKRLLRNPFRRHAILKTAQRIYAA